MPNPDHAKLPCGHPIDCARDLPDDETGCMWCSEVRQLKETVRQLRDELHKPSIIYHGVDGGYGSKPSQLHINGDIGYLEIFGGELHIADSHTISTLIDHR